MGHSYDAIFRVVVRGGLHGQEWNNVYFFRTKEGTPSLTLTEDTDALITDFDSLLVSSLQQSLSAEASIISITATCLEPPHMAQSIKFYTSKVGSVVGESLPSFCSAVISWYTKFNGKRLHGRTYLPAIPEANTAQGNIDATHLSRINTFANSLYARFWENGTSTRFRFVVYSRKNGVTRNPLPPHELHYSPLAGVPVYRYTLVGKVYTQRHRMLGKGI